MAKRKKKKQQAAARSSAPRLAQGTQGVKPEAPTPLLKVLLWGALIINGMTALSLGIALLTSSMVAFIICTLLALVTLIGGSFVMGPSSIYATILAFIGVAISGMEGPDYLEQRRGLASHNLLTAEAARDARVTKFYFQDAAVMRSKSAQFTHVYHTTNSSTKVRERHADEFFIAPLTYPGWTNEDLIPAWVICADPRARSCVKEWAEDYKSAVRLGGRNEAHYQETKALFFKKYHGLSEAKGAPYLAWTKDPEQYIKSKERIILISFIFMNLLWLVVMPIVRFRNKDEPVRS